MFGVLFRYEDSTRDVKKASDKATFRNLQHAAASLRKDAQRSIEKAPAKTRARRRSGKIIRRATHKPAPAGHPPYTQRGQLPRAIVYDVQKNSAVIGPRHSVAGESGAAHEFGGDYKGAQYPERSFMGPALGRAATRFAGSYRGSIGPH